ncbi:MAG: hypothetical protein U0L11_09605 [Acutalibacteraceae bacterium]|nr:hypothetical protein [Acutalibacteraceae bacterium]
MKRIIAIFLVFSILFAFASCKSKEKDDGIKAEIVTNLNGEAVTNSNGEVFTEIVTEGDSTTHPSTVPPTTTPTLSNNPSDWTEEQIVEFYKASAIKSKASGVVSRQTMAVKEMVVNDGNGLLGTLMKIAEPLMMEALKRHIKEYVGITGGVENFTVNDIESAKAYKNGEYTIVEVELKEQVDGPHGDMLSGTTGHAISVVGDISVVTNEFPMFDIEIEEEDLRIYYYNPKFIVKINKDGIIEKGSWSYLLYAEVNGIEIESIVVDSAYGSVDYLVTVGGGF